MGGCGRCTDPGLETTGAGVGKSRRTVLTLRAAPLAQALVHATDYHRHDAAIAALAHALEAHPAA